MTTDPKCIMAELRKFYSDLYTPRSLKTETECMDYVRILNIPKLSNDDRLSCEDKLTLQECWEALNSMKNCKTPRNDGLTKEFYVCFFKQLGKLLVSTLDYSLIMASEYITKASRYCSHPEEGQRFKAN